MTLSHSRIRLVLFILSLLAIGGIVGVSAHGHEHADGDEHADCWFCASSFAKIAILGAVLVFALTCPVVGQVAVAIRLLVSDLHFISASPRAPPT